MPIINVLYNVTALRFCGWRVCVDGEAGCTVEDGMHGCWVVLPCGVAVCGSYGVQGPGAWVSYPVGVEICRSHALWGLRCMGSLSVVRQGIAVFEVCCL